MGESTTKIDLSGTHLPVLSRLLIATNGSVLELGAGFNSTPLLYWYCKAYDRKFVSYENDREWCKKLSGMTTPIDKWEDLEIDKLWWSIVLIDHRPAIRRHKDAIKMKDKADFVVLHDSEPEIDRFYAYRRVYPHFKYRYDFTKFKPYTTILSNYYDPSLIFKG